MENEVWRAAKYIYGDGTVVDFNNYYEVSSLGRIRSLDKYLNGGYGSKRLVKGKIFNIKQYDNQYVRFVLYMDNVRYNIYIHRLVASTFPETCGKWFQGAECNHLSECKSDNRAINLKWVTSSDNKNWGTRAERTYKTNVENGLWYEGGRTREMRNQHQKEYYWLNRDDIMKRSKTPEAKEKRMLYAREYRKRRKESGNPIKRKKAAITQP